MMTLGSNVKITLAESARPLVRAMFDALGAPGMQPNERMDVYAGGGAGHVGFDFVADGEALTPAQMRIAPWLELAVDDVDAARARLEAVGLARLEYEDKTHPYFVGPGGLVFRLTAAPR